MDDLKECPFCGGEAQHLRLNNVVGCPPCGVWMADHRKEDWNRRAVPQANAEQDAQDAARYRWLRDEYGLSTDHLGIGKPFTLNSSLDREIDAAIRAASNAASASTAKED